MSRARKPRLKIVGIEHAGTSTFTIGKRETTTYRCWACGATAAGKPGLNLMCGACVTRMHVEGEAPNEEPTVDVVTDLAFRLPAAARERLARDILAETEAEALLKARSGEVPT